MWTWNPFALLRKTKKYPFSHFFGSSLWQRLKDSFFVFSGGQGVFDQLFTEDSMSAGIFSYVVPAFLLVIPLLGLAYVSVTAMQWLFKNFSLIPLPPIVALAAAGAAFLAAAAILEGSKAVLSAVFTLAISPLVLLAHAFSFLSGLSWKRQIQQLPVKKITTSLDQETEPQEDTTLKLLLQGRSTADIEKIFAVPEYLNGEPVLILKTDNSLREAIIQVQPKTVLGIKALLNTNTFLATQNTDDQAEFFHQKLMLESTNANRSSP
jgi:hypothetical protein